MNIVMWNLDTLAHFLKRVSGMILAGLLGTLTYAQDQKITLEEAPPTVSTGAFATTAVPALNKGQSLPANFIIGNGCKQLWDRRTHAFVTGDRTVTYPVVGIVNCSDADGFTVFASSTVFRGDTKSGSARSGGYLLQLSQATKAGEAIPSLLFIGKGFISVLSMEPAQGQKDKADAAQPWLTIFDERLNPSDRPVVLEAWRAASQTVPGMLKIPGMFKLLP